MDAPNSLPPPRLFSAFFAVLCGLSRLHRQHPVRPQKGVHLPLGGGRLFTGKTKSFSCIKSHLASAPKKIATAARGFLLCTFACRTPNSGSAAPPQSGFTRSARSASTAPGSFAGLLMADLGPGQPGTQCSRTCRTGSRRSGAQTGSSSHRRTNCRRGSRGPSPKLGLVGQSRSQSGRSHTSPDTTPTRSRACHTNPTHWVDNCPPSSSGAATEPQGWQRRCRRSRRHTRSNHKSSPSPHESHSQS